MNRNVITIDIISLLGILILIVRFLVVDLEVSELVAVLGVGNHTQPVSQVVLLQVLLGEVLQVSLGEGDVGGEGDLCLLPLHGELLAEVAGLASNLDALLEVLLEVSAVHDTILDGVGAVNEELDLVLLPKLLHTLALALELLLAGLLAGGLLLCRCHLEGPLLRDANLKHAKPEIGPIFSSGSSTWKIAEYSI